MPDRRENFAITALAVLVGCVLVFMIYSFSGVSEGHQRIEAIVSASAERLEALESNKAKATAKRWTADDQMEYIACMEFANFSPERRTCLNRIKARFQAAQQ